VAAIRRQAFLIVGITTVVASLAQLKTSTEKPVYSSQFEILTKSVTAEEAVISSVPQTLSNRQQEPVTPDTTATTIRVLTSPRLLLPIVEQLKPKYPDLSSGAIAQSLSITPNGESILAISFSGGDEALVQDVVEVLAQEYLDYSLEERQKDVRQGINFVEEQLPKLEARVSDQQGKLQQFRQQYNLIDPQTQAQSLSTQASTLAQTQLDTQTRLDEARLLYAGIQTELAGQPIEVASASALDVSARYQKLLDQLLAVDSQIAQQSALYLEDSPEIQVLLDQRRNLEPLLQQESRRVERSMASSIQDLENREQALSQSITVLNQRIKQLSVITREYTDIQREVQIATDNLNQFLTKREGLRIDAAQRQIPWQLLTPPGEPIPSAASAKRNLILGTSLGVLLGVGAALALDRLSNVIHTAKEVKSTTKLPLLGIIPLNHNLDNFKAMQDATFLLRSASPGLAFASNPFQEAFRSLYANLRLLNPDSPVRSLVISSPTLSNGKTTLATHLALAAAATGQRVLLVDTDLRRPSLHKSLGLSNEIGLTDVISANLDFHSALQSISWEPNLSFLSSGVLPPDPTRILASQSMNSFMATAVEQFDLVIYDAPPLLGFADPYLFAAHTDGILLVVRLNHLKRVLLEQSMNELAVAAVPILGAVANASEETSFTSSHYYQQYVQQPQPGSPLLALTARTPQLSKLTTTIFNKLRLKP
jgi:capsular exopolysaccharide synthesis family protein